MASKHLWIAELQDRDGKVVEYHSLELEPEHYKDRTDWNRAMTSWSAFRQRERGNLKSNRSPRSKVQWACHWMTQDDITFFIEGVPEMPLHKTIWDLYAAIGYDYKTKRYDRPEQEKNVSEEKRMRGDTPGLVHLDESGFMNKDGQQILVASGSGRHEYVVEVEGQIIPVTADQIPGAGLADGSIVQQLAQNIADKVNAEPNLEAKKRLLDAELKHYANEQERADHAAHILKHVKMPGDARNDPRVIAHKRGVVKAHQKLKRQQAKKEKLKALQLRSFNGK